MTSKQMECFVAVAKYQSYKRAAEMCFVSQPSISYQIKALEAELGFELFDQEKRTQLTASGSHFYNCAVKVLDEWEHGVKECRVLAGVRREVLHIGLRRSIDENAVVRVLSRFIKEQNEYSFLIHTFRGGFSILDLLQGVRDVLFVDSTEIEDYKNVCYSPLCKSCWGYAINKNHPLSRKDVISFSDLEGEHVMLPETPPGMDQCAHARDIMRYSKPAMVSYSSSFENAVMCAAAGLTISSINYSYEYPMENVVYRPALGFEDTTMGLAWREDDDREGISLFVEIAKKEFK